MVRTFTRYVLFCLNPTFWLSFAWIIPLLILPTFATTPLTRLEGLHTMYTVGFYAAILFLLWTGIPLIIDLCRRKIKIDAQIGLALLIGATATFYGWFYYHELTPIKKDLALYHEHKTIQVDGTIEVLTKPVFNGRGGTSYLYTLKINGKELSWYHKSTTHAQFNKKKTYHVTYVPHTKEILSIQ